VYGVWGSGGSGFIVASEEDERGDASRGGDVLRVDEGISLYGSAVMFWDMLIVVLPVSHETDVMYLHHVELDSTNQISQIAV
jgi:hypothetical protein